jgi:deoxyadenosine/deoxycytidine kinase
MKWMESYDLGKVLIIEADHYNFPNNKDHLSEVIDKINAELHGLF